MTRIAAAGCLAISGASSYGQALIYGSSVDGDIFSFSSDAPGLILSSHAISGLESGETLRGIDWRAGTIFGVGSQNHLYTVDPTTGAATMLNTSPFTPVLNGSAFGVDDGPAGIQVVSNLRQNLTLDRGTGVVLVEGPKTIYAAGDPFEASLPNISALAYDSGAGVWYAGDSVLNTFATFDPTSGELSTLGLAGIDFSRINGFDISSFDGVAYFASPQTSSDPQANFYTLNKTTGTVTLVGLIGNTGDNILVNGLTVAVPEPGTLGLFALGGLLLAMVRRK
jgi:hypothetical protein